MAMHPARAIICGLVAMALPVLCVQADEPPVRGDLTPAERERVAAVTAPATDFSGPEDHEALPGGATTSRRKPDANALTHPSANLTGEDRQRFVLGNALFGKLWVSSPSSTRASDGLGPLFNARSCMSCHIRDGRGHPPEGKADATSMFLRLSRAPKTPEENLLLEERRLRFLPDPVYGRQLQDHAVPGLKAEGRMVIDYTEMPVTLGDGTVVSLRKPRYSVADPGYGPLDPSTVLSPRVTPAMTGLGLIEAIPEADLLALADPDDRNGDGISGRPNRVADPATGQLATGRFGWKASNPTVRAQVAEAFSGDIGISTPDLPHAWGDCTETQTACRAAPGGEQADLGTGEAPEAVIDLVTFHSRHLAVPERRGLREPQVLRGKALFHGAGCATCHHPKFVTARDAPDPALAFQLIWPYSDFLLHDMGVGLADWMNDGDARGTEWRTPPLWGIGLVQTVNGHSFFLHDGRARSLTEAVLWHGGEAQAARDAFATLPAEDRAALITFLESL